MFLTSRRVVRSQLMKLDSGTLFYYKLLQTKKESLRSAFCSQPHIVKFMSCFLFQFRILKANDHSMLYWEQFCLTCLLFQVKEGVDSIIILGSWLVWKHRNYCVFDGGTPSLSRVMTTFREDVQQWSVAGARGVSYLLALPPTSQMPWAGGVWSGLIVVSVLREFIFFQGVLQTLYPCNIFCFSGGSFPPFYLLNILMRSSPARSRKKKLLLLLKQHTTFHPFWVFY